MSILFDVKRNWLLVTNHVGNSERNRLKSDRSGHWEDRRSAWRTVTPQLDLIDQRLMRMEQKVERLLAIHLNAALIYLQSGDYQNARTKLVEAVAAEPYSAVAKFWYGVTLYLNGQSDLAKDEIGGFAAQSLHRTKYQGSHI